MPQPAPQPPAVAVDENTPVYSLSEATKPTSAAAALAAIAPHLKEAALRLAVCLAAITEHRPHHTIRITTRELSERTGLVPSALNRAISQLCDPQRGYVTLRRGSTTQANAYMVNFLATVRSASFREAPPKEALPATLLPFEDEGASFGEAPPAENTALARAAAASDLDVASLRLIDRVFSATTTHFDQELIVYFRRWMAGHMGKFGVDEWGKPVQNPHPPKDAEVEQFLRVAEPERLARLLQDLLHERHPVHKYIWFTTVALQRCAGIDFRLQKQARAALKEAKRALPTAPPEPAQAYFDGQEHSEMKQKLAAIAGRKKIR